MPKQHSDRKVKTSKTTKFRSPSKRLVEGGLKSKQCLPKDIKPSKIKKIVPWFKA